MSQPITPRVFVSAASSDLGSARKVASDALMRIECLAVEESIFGTEYGVIREMLERKIASCQAVVHLVGRDCGGEPDPQTLPAGQSRRSWTQIEYDLAKQLKKKLYILVCEDAFPFDPRPHPEPDEKAALQIAHRQAVLADVCLWHTVHDTDQLRQQVENLKIPLDEVRDQLRRQQFRYRLQLGIVAAAVLLVSVGVISGLRQLGKKMDKTGGQVAAVGSDVKAVGTSVSKVKDQIEEAQQATVRQLTDPVALAASIRKQIEAAAQAKIAELPDEKGRWRKVAEIERERDVQIGRVDDLMRLIQDGLKEGASPVFQRATEILEQEGIDEALTYLENQRPATLETAKRHAERAAAEKEQRNRALQALLLEADLLETKLNWQHALDLREQVAQLAPDWFVARNRLGNLLNQLARFREAEPHLRAAVALGASPGEQAMGLNNLASLLQATSRLAEAESLLRQALAIDEQSDRAEQPDVARDLNNLASLLLATNRLAEAEPLMRRALAIDEQSYRAEHPDVAIDLNNLAQLLQATNRLAEAEPLMRRALAIDEQSYRAEHPNVATCLNNLGSLLQATNRLTEAEPLMRRALAIDEQSYRAEHPDVARDLNNLALLLQATNHLAEAEPLMRRALAIDEQSYGAEHPSVAIRLSNLAQLLRATNRLAEAEPLTRRALAIHEQSYGAEHPDVAIDLNNVAQLLQATGRLAEAEPLLRRGLDVLEKSLGGDHPNVATCLNNLALLLQDTNRLTEAELVLRRCLEITRKFHASTGREHPDTEPRLQSYRLLLAAMELPPEEIERRARLAPASAGRLKPIAPDVERLLGPAKSVKETLAELDRKYKTEGKPAVYFLPPDQPIAPQLDELLKPDGDALNAMGVAAFRNSDYGDAVVRYEEAIKLYEANAGRAQEVFVTRMNQAAALRELGQAEQARDELRRLLPELAQDPAPAAIALGRFHHHLALCHWRLGDREAAQREAEESLRAYSQASDKDPVPTAMQEQTQQLLADLKEGKPPPPLAEVDAAAELKKARTRFQARETLAKLPLDQPTAPLLDQLLAPAKSVNETLAELDRQYKAESKPAVYFLPLSEPIAPHLDELLGPLPARPDAARAKKTD